MPLHDFKCYGCEHIFEDLTTTGQVWSQCPECGLAAKKLSLIGRTSFSLSGGGLGWAASGYDRNFALHKDKDDPTPNK